MLSRVMLTSQLRDSWFESRFATVSGIGHFRSLHDAPVHRAVKMSTLTLTVVEM